MLQVNIAEAKRDFSRLIRLIETNKQDIIRVARNGAPVAEIHPAKKNSASKRIGIGKGRFHAPDDFDASNEEVYNTLSGGPLL